MSGQVISPTPLGFAKEQSSSDRPRVLLADDHDMVLDRVQSLLENYEVVGTAHNGSDLVNEALRLQPDVIILDITMPLLNGIDAAHEIREGGSTSKFALTNSYEYILNWIVPQRAKNGNDGVAS